VTGVSLLEAQEQFTLLWDLGSGLLALGENVAVDQRRGECPVLVMRRRPFPLRVRVKMHKGARVYTWGWAPWCRTPVAGVQAAERLLRQVSL
jgi:hypothetical protein